jgi:hypothetical protein
MTEDRGERSPLGRRRLTRRAVLGGAAVGGVFAAGGAGLGVWLAGSSDNESPATPSATPTTVPTQTAAAITEVTPSPWETKTFAPGEVIDWPTGAFFMDIESGGVEAWRLAPAGRPGPESQYFPYVVPGGEFVVVQSDAVYAVARSSGEAFTWPAGQSNLLATSGDSALFVRQNAILITDRAAEPRATIALSAGAQLLNTPLFSPDGKSVLLVLGPARQTAGDVRLQLHAVSDGSLLADERVQTIGATESPDVLLFPAPLAKEVVLTLTTHSFDNGGQVVGSPRYSYARVAWAMPSGTVELHDLPASIDSVSPDGRLAVSDVLMRSVASGGLGGGEAWVASGAGAVGEPPSFYVLSASAPLWSFFGQRWLADGSAFTVMVDGGPGAGMGTWDQVAYALVSADGSKMQPLDLPPEPAAYQQAPNAWRGPFPHPTDPDLVALGVYSVLNLKTGRYLAPRFASGIGPPLLSRPWDGRPSEVTFSLPVPGKDGPTVPSLVRPAIHTTLPHEPLRFRVRAGGDCLNVRALPNLDGQVLDCLADGTEVTLAPRSAESDPPWSFARTEDGAWVWVSAASGATGWVTASYLEWP